MMFGWIFILIIIILAIGYLYRQGFSLSQNKEESAFEILKKRYARGELNREEFEKQKQYLEEN